MPIDNVPTSNLDFVNAINHPNNKVVLSSIISANSISNTTKEDKVWGVSGFLTQDLNISNSGTGWSSLFGESAMLAFMSNMYNKGAAALDIIAGVDAPQTTFKSILQTQLNFSGTRPFELTIPMMFIALTRKDIENNIVLNNIRSLKEAEYPNLSDLANTNFRIEAPLGYRAGDVLEKGGKKGAIDIKIGQYFQTKRRIMLVTGSQFFLSKETVSNNSPLLAVGTVSLVASRVVSSKEVKSYFVLNN